ncbi:MAG: cyclic nucleotide-binding domain-containing protein [Acidobacteria bacterium]|nr:cyclic nucleotide-binding domain-containing protein [Acidobacteriota bacterium]
MAFFSKKEEDHLALIQKGDFKKAIKVIFNKLKTSPTDLNLKLKLAECYEGLKDYENAIRVYLDASEECQKSGEKEKAFALLKKAQKIMPESIEVSERLNALETKKDVESFSFDIEVDAATSKELTEEQKEIKELLKPIFPIGENALSKICEGFEIFSLKNGETLINEGDMGKSLYLVVDGKLKVYSKDFGDGEPIQILEKGEIVGEVSFLKGVPRTATLIAEGDTKVGELTEEKAKDVLTPYPELMKILEEILEKRVFTLISKIKDESLWR